VPQGTEARLEFSRGFYQVALSMNPKPSTVAIVGADAEYAHIATDGARENAQKHGLKIVYDRTYPPNTVDFVPIVRAIQATSPDLVFLASYPLDSAGVARAVNEVGLTTKMFGGGMVGLQYAALKQQLGSLLNGNGNAVDQFKLPGKQVIIFPTELRSGEFIYPFSDIRR
jgi:branched-chain amino acid transport system substrate-binding protein